MKTVPLILPLPLLFASVLAIAVGQAPPPPPPVPDAVPADEREKPAAEEPELPAPSAGDLDQLIAGLAADAFELREKAQAALNKYARLHPREMKEAILPRYVAAADPEVRFRLVAVLFESARYEMRGRPRGFLGIWMHSSQVRLADGSIAGSVLVREVMRDTAAAEAGLLAGDHIVAVDKMAFSPPPRPVIPQQMASQENLEEFKQYIESKRKGDAVALKVRRQNQDVNMRVLLGKRPDNLRDLNEEQREQEEFDRWLEAELKSVGEGGAAP